MEKKDLNLEITVCHEISVSVESQRRVENGVPGSLTSVLHF